VARVSRLALWVGAASKSRLRSNICGFVARVLESR